MRMDDRSSKRARQQREGGGGGGGGGGLPAGAENEFGAGFPRASLAGCHLEVKPSQTHLFVGMAIELKVSILNDEDVVQQTTQGINVSITGEDGRVVATHPNMFELTPQRPALLDGSTTFHLLLWEGCVRTGNRIKVHVETSSGRGREQIKADSEPIMVCRSALTVVSQPPESWYKDEGGKNNCIAIEAMVREKLPSGQVGQAQPGVPLTLALVYEAGTEVHSQEILQVQSDTQLVTNEHGRANLKFKITEVSQRHQSQRFCVKICPDVRLAPEFSNVAPVVTVPVMVLSKRKNRRLKAEKMAQSAAGGYVPSSSGMGNMAGLMWATAGANGHLPPPNMDVVSSLPPSHWPSPAAPSILNGAPAGRGGGRMGSSPPSAQHQHLQQQQQQPHLQHNPQQEAVAAAVNALHRAPGGGAVAPQAPVSAPVEDAPLRVPPGATGSLQKVFRWTDAVLQLLQMELQWQHIGYERDEADGSACYSRPLFRCPVCRVCKGSAQPHQKHAADCKLSGLLAEFSGRRNGDFAALVEQQQQLRGGGSSRSSASPPVSSGMAGTRGGGGAAAAAGGRGGADGRGLKDGYGEGNGAAARIAEMHRGPASVILGLKNAPEGASGEGGPGGSLIRESPPGRDREDGNGNVVSVPLSSMRDQSGHYLPPVQSHELLRAGSGGMSRGLSIGFGGMFDNGMVPTSSGGGASRDGEKEGLPRTGSVAPFVPKDDLTPAEERAQYIMLPEGAAGEGGGGGGGGSKQLTVFSEKGLLLGFYDEKYDVGQQTHLPFQGVENNFSSNAKRALEAKLRAAIDNERSSRAAAASGGKAAADTMDTDDGGDNNTGGAQSKKRERGGRPTRSTSAAAAAAAAAAAGGSGVKRESTGGGKKEPAAFPKVYTLSDFKSYQEMKRQVFYDWSLGPQMDMNVFDSEKTDGKAPTRTSPR